MISNIFHKRLFHNSFRPLVYQVNNYINGNWKVEKNKDSYPVVDPYDSSKTIALVNPVPSNYKSIKIPSVGLHNPLFNQERILELGKVMRILHFKMRYQLYDHFVGLIMKFSPKSLKQAQGEVDLTIDFLEKLCGYSAQTLFNSTTTVGDRSGQESTEYRFPFGTVYIICPFNFPLEIPALQLIGAIMMGNYPVLHVDYRVAYVMEQFIRLMLEIGESMPINPIELDFISGKGMDIEKCLIVSDPALTVFTGSSTVAEKLAILTKGKIKMEGGGYNTTILGSDVPKDNKIIDYIISQIDQDAFSCSGQKCSALRILFAHKNWIDNGLLQKIEKRASTRNINDKTIVPLLSVQNNDITEYINELMKLEGAKKICGEILNQDLYKGPYGMSTPTICTVPFKSIIEEKSSIIGKELFGPILTIVPYDDEDIINILSFMRKLEHQLTCAIVSNDVWFRKLFESRTHFGVQYSGYFARTTGTLQNRRFGPGGGDIRGGNIGTIEAIREIWSHPVVRIRDNGFGRPSEIVQS